MKNLQLSDEQRIMIAQQILEDNNLQGTSTEENTLITNAIMLGFCEAERMLKDENQSSDETYEDAENFEAEEKLREEREKEERSKNHDKFFFTDEEPVILSRYDN